MNIEYNSAKTQRFVNANVMKIWKYICKIVNAYETCVACFHLFIKYPYLLACQPFIIHKWHNKAQKHENSKGSKENKKWKGTLKTLEGCKNVKVENRGEGDERTPPSPRFRQEYLFFRSANCHRRAAVGHCFIVCVKCCRMVDSVPIWHTISIL